MFFKQGIGRKVRGFAYSLRADVVSGRASTTCNGHGVSLELMALLSIDYRKKSSSLLS